MYLFIFLTILCLKWEVDTLKYQDLECIVKCSYIDTKQYKKLELISSEGSTFETIYNERSCEYYENNRIPCYYYEYHQRLSLYRIFPVGTILLVIFSLKTIFLIYPKL